MQIEAGAVPRPPIDLVAILVDCLLPADIASHLLQVPIHRM